MRQLALAAVLFTVSSAVVGASSFQRVTAEVMLTRYSFVCGHPRASVAVVFPTVVRVPRSIATADIRLNGLPAGTVAVTARTVKITPAAPGGIQCDSIVVGRLRIAFARAAGISTGGGTRTYRVVVHVGTKTERAVLTLSA